MAWQIGATMNLVIALAYLSIAWAIMRPLASSKQLRSNRLGLATAAIFFTCAVHHGHHGMHLLLPYVGQDLEVGAAIRDYWRWDLAGWDLISAGVAIYYWSLRKTYGPLMRGAKLFDDLRERQQQALEINDNIVQGLTVAKMSLDMGMHDRSRDALEGALASARGIITELLGEANESTEFHPGALRRRSVGSIG